MTNDGREMYWVLRAALPASLVLHLIIIALLMFGLPVSLATPQKEDAISVDLVPPPKPEAKPLPKPVAKAEAEPKPRDKPKVEPPQAARPEPAKPLEAQSEPLPPAADPAAKKAAAALQPAVRFGEKDAGPKASPQGSSADDRPPLARPEAKPDEQDVATPPTITLNELAVELPKPDPGAPDARKSSPPVEKTAPPKLDEAKTLYSPAMTDSPAAMTAMRNTPRGIRAGRLCLTELRAQLQHAEPAYLADLLPTDALRDGSTAIDIADAAFRADLKWYHLGYRCEVDGDAMKVVSFAYRVGTPIPRSEWKQRGLPAQ